MQGIGIGIRDFKRLRERDNYFIDKTLYIKDIIDNQSGVILITRPRRFGKTLNMSMLRYYFDCTQKDTTKLFEGLKIMDKVLEDKEEKTIEETIENAKKQIEERKYEQNLQERGFTNITKMVFAFQGKNVKMEVI